MASQTEHMSTGLNRSGVETVKLNNANGKITVQSLIITANFLCSHLKLHFMRNGGSFHNLRGWFPGLGRCQIWMRHCCSLGCPVWYQFTDLYTPIIIS